MNKQSFERQLQQSEVPAPEVEARARARQAAVAEFERLHVRKAPQPAFTWKIPKLWMSGFATACVAIVGVSIFWLAPESERVVAPESPATVAQVQTDSVLVAPAIRPSIKQEPPPAQDAPASPFVIAEAKDSRSGLRTLVDGRGTVSSSKATDVAELNVVPPNPPQRGDLASGATAAAPVTALLAETTTLQMQPAPPTSELSEVQVTGTRIPANRAAGGAVTSISAEEMQRLGIVSTADALTQLVPSQLYSGSTVANLRGQDPSFGSRTLTLIDGRRVVVMPSAPATTGGDSFAHFEVNPVKRTADEPVSTFSADVDTASYSFVRRQLNSGVLPPADAVRTEEMINYFDYAWPAAGSRDQPFRPTVTVSDSPWNAGRKLVHIGIKGYELPARQRPDVNLVLLLDVSGSMNSPDKLPLAQRSMAMLLDSLKPTDTVGIAVYAGAAGEVLPPTPVRDKDAILQALYSLRPGGSTAGAAGIQLAYEMAARNFRKEGVNRILLATDGDFNVGIRDPNELKNFVQRQREKGVFLSVLGFGAGNYRDDTAQTLAQNGNGVAAYIDTLNEARKVLVQQAGAQLFTIAKDVKLQVEFNPDTVAEYRLVGYETRALNREDFNNDKVDAGDVGAGHTVTAIYEITPVGATGLVDERRYAADGKPATARGKADEYGYLKIRYKLPGQDRSRLIEQPISVKAGVPAAVRQDVQFATAVAGFAQLLQGGRYIGALSYEDVLNEAEDGIGKDANGYRGEFLQLVRRADTLLAQKPLF